MPKLNNFHYALMLLLFLYFFSASKDNNSIHSNNFIERVEPSLLKKISKLNIVYSGDLPSEFILPNFLSSSLFSAKIYDKNKRNIVLYSYFGDGTIRFFNISNSEMQFIEKVPTQHTASKITIIDIDKDGKDEIVFSEGSKIRIIESNDMTVQGRVIQLSEFIHDISFGDIDNDGIPELIAFSTALNGKSNENFIKFNLSLWKFKDSTYTLLWNKRTEYTHNFYDKGGNSNLEKVIKGPKNTYYLKIYFDKSDCSPSVYDILKIDKNSFNFIRQDSDGYITLGNPDNNNIVEIDPDGKGKGYLAIDRTNKKYAFYR